MTISQISALQIFDSRGNPTVEAHVMLDNGVTGRGLVPSGASRGAHEAWELRDGDPALYLGKSVQHAIDNVHAEIAPALKGMDPLDQASVDRRMIELDGTANKQRLGANAILAVSMATAHAAAVSQGLQLFEQLGSGTLLPLPEIQIIGGGAHAAWRTDVQDFMIIPVGARSYPQALRMVFDVYHACGRLLRQRGKGCGVADEGGYWPDFAAHTEIFELILEAIAEAGYIPGRDVALSLDIAASELYDAATATYGLRLENRRFTSAEFAIQIAAWCLDYHIISVEDPLADSDWDGWTAFTAHLGDRIQIIGDDLFTTNLARIWQGIDRRSANAVLIKPNQIGTVTETLDAIALTQQAGWRPVVSARSGETEDAFISHLAVATSAGQLKVGSFSRGERMSKWNELLRIQETLGSAARFEGASVLPGPPSS